MAILGKNYLDLIDIYKNTDGMGNVVPVIEALHAINPIMRDANVLDCNNGTKHRTVVRSGLPESTWGRLYKGTPFSTAQEVQVEDVTGWLEQLCGVDSRLLKMQPNKAPQIRLSKAAAHLEGMTQDFETAFFYSNVMANGDQMHGLTPRFNMLEANPAAGPAAHQVIDAGGTGSDLTSVWMVTWGDNQLSLLTPEGVPGGIQREDKGEVPTLDSDGNQLFMKQELFTQHAGLTLGDYRFITRIANIDVSDLIAGTVDIYSLMRQAYYRNQGRRNKNIGNSGMVPMGSMVIYCNATVLEALDALGTDQNNSALHLRPMELQGEEVDSWRSHPVRETDALLNTETRVV